MGARTNFNFITAEGEMVLYSHWGGDSKKTDLAGALNAAMPRIKMGDTSYALRIIISQLIGDSWDSETGYGLFLGPNGGEEQFDYLGVDFVKGLVITPEVTRTFKEFIDFYGRSLAAVGVATVASSDN
jgi:hypothetical protein